MKTGYVDEGWAEEHHTLWHDDIAAGKIPAQRSVAAAPAASSPPPERERNPDASFLLSSSPPPPRSGGRRRARQAAAADDEAKAKAAEAASRAAWTDKVGAYKLCQSMDRVAPTLPRARGRRGQGGVRRRSRRRPAPIPDPYVPLQITPTASKPLEAAGAHSPPGTAATPPSNKATSAEMTGTRK